MQLTRVSEDTGKLGFAGNWWLFLITAIPLTLITLGVLVIAWRLEKKRKMNDPLRNAGRA
jgi:ABC-type transport system involved in Fe-S cluster assembly fused permease/ATPase subunit